MMADSENVVRYKGTATGRVQGVGFRAFVQKHAMKRGIKGWVRNMSDGSVTMEAEGDKTSLEALHDDIMKGNLFIKVKALSWEEMPIKCDEDDFVILK